HASLSESYEDSIDLKENISAVIAVPPAGRLFTDQADRHALLRADDGRDADFLPDSRKRDAQTSLARLSVLRPIEHVFDRIRIRTFQSRGLHFASLRTIHRLHRHESVVVVAGNRAPGSLHHETALRLRLMGPRIGESAPAGFELGKPR